MGHGAHGACEASCRLSITHCLRLLGMLFVHYLMTVIDFIVLCLLSSSMQYCGCNVVLIVVMSLVGWLMNDDNDLCSYGYFSASMYYCTATYLHADFFINSEYNDLRRKCSLFKATKPNYSYCVVTNRKLTK